MKGRRATSLLLLLFFLVGVVSSLATTTLRPFATSPFTQFTIPYVSESEEQESGEYGHPSTEDPTLFYYGTTTTETTTMATSSRPTEVRNQNHDVPLEFADILPADRRSYDKMEPPKKDGKPTTVFFHVTVMSLDSIDESSMTYAADIFFSQSWQDYRLRFPDNLTAEYRLLPTSWLNSMWRPDSFFKNAKKVTFQDVTIPNHYIWLYKDKSILYMVKLTLILSCSMNFHLYPHDTQRCAMKIESLSHTTDDLVFIWERSVPLVVDDRIELPQLDLVSNITGYCTQVYSTGNFTCLEVILSFRRRLGYYLFHTYIPTCLIVVMSWISFWIRPEAVPARVTLGVTSLLTLHTQHANSQKSLPPVSYIKAIDVFMSGCTVFVFFSLMEYALVNILMGDIVDGEESVLKKGMKSMFATAPGAGNPGGSARMSSTSSQQLMEAQPNNTRCLRNAIGTSNHPPTTPLPLAPSPPTSMNRSQSVMTKASTCPSHHHYHTCRHAAQVHEPSSRLTDQQRRPNMRNDAVSGSSSLSILHQEDAINSNAPACGRERFNNFAVSTSHLNAILPSIEECPAPPPPTPAVFQRKNNNRDETKPPSNPNGRLPLISSLHSAGKNAESMGTTSTQKASLPHQQKYNGSKSSLNLQQLRRSRAIAVDRVSRTFFPLSFTILNIAYWCVFLNSEDVVTGGS